MSCGVVCWMDGAIQLRCGRRVLLLERIKVGNLWYWERSQYSELYEAVNKPLPKWQRKYIGKVLSSRQERELVA